MNIPPIITQQAPPAIPDKGRASAVRAAKFSLWAFIVVIPLNIAVVSALTAAQVHGLLASLIQCLIITVVLVVGFWCGCSSLLATRRYGRPDIWGRALAGVIINGLLLAFFLYALYRGIQSVLQHSPA
jgi:hypothetical protein